jgi:hypothetical protein
LATFPKNVLGILNSYEQEIKQIKNFKKLKTFNYCKNVIRIIYSVIRKIILMYAMSSVHVYPMTCSYQRQLRNSPQGEDFSIIKHFPVESHTPRLRVHLTEENKEMAVSVYDMHA